MASELKVLVVDPIHFKLRNYLEDNFYSSGKTTHNSTGTDGVVLKNTMYW